MRENSERVVDVPAVFQECSEPPDDEAADLALMDFATLLYRSRRRRSTILPGSIFGEPAWDILLDLFISEKKNTPVSITDACIAADTPATTALRWIQILEEHGLVERKPDPQDGRRTFLHLTRPGEEKMTTFLARANIPRRV